MGDSPHTKGPHTPDASTLDSSLPDSLIGDGHIGDEPIRVAVVEDDPLQLRIASQVVKNDRGLLLVGGFESGRGALDALVGPSPRVTADVVIIDLELPDINGAEVARTLRALPNPPEVVVLTAHGERSMALEALKAGASGYLLKGSPGVLPDAIRAAAAGGSTIAPEIARYLLDEIRVPAKTGDRAGVPLRELGRQSALGQASASTTEGESATDHPSLTRRECEVLQLLAKGATYDDSARILGISLGTIQSHVKRLYRKLEVSSKAEAAAEAVRRGLADP